MRYLIIASIFLLSQSVESIAQFEFAPDSQQEVLFPDIIEKLELSSSDFEFQFRFWIHGGITLPSTKDLFTMTYNDGIWICNSYRFIYDKRKKYRVQKHEINCNKGESLWSDFMANDILMLPNMDSLRKDFYFINENGDTASIIVTDGLQYSFEFATHNSYKRIEYHCPIKYGDRFPDIEELKKVSNIIRSIYGEIGKETDPC